MSYDTINAVVPICLIGISLWFGYQIVKQEPYAIWTPALLFLGHVALFRGIGPLVYIFSNPITQEKIRYGAWSITDAELLDTHLLNSVGSSSILLGCLLFLSTIARRKPEVVPTGPKISVLQAAMCFLVPGALIRYGVVIPNTFGIAPAFVVPGFLLKLSFLVDIGFALLAFLAVRQGGFAKTIFWILFLPHYFTLFLEFKKSALMIGAMLPIIGAYMGNRNLRGMVLNLLLLAVIYIGSQPIVHYARAEMNEISGSIFGASFSQRVEIATGVIFGTTDSIEDIIAEDETQSGWLRLSYAANQAIAMRAYDLAGPTDTIRSVWQVFIPRFIWPEKPSFIYLGSDFYYVITGRDSTTLVGSTIHADSYWNYGWPGVIFIGCAIGVFFGFASNLALIFLRRHDFIYLPAIMLSMDIAMRQLNGWVLTGFFGQMPFYFAFLGMVWVLSQIATTLAKEAAPQSARPNVLHSDPSKTA
ncbi:hypothetical protein [Pelagimonas varians]|nr:hypothetical protein [Pelagimonas varians]